MSGSPTRVFIARLAGIAVFTPAGDQVGRVRDAVVSLRTDIKTPRVLGLVVEVQPRRPVFLPITRVTTIESDAVVFDGRLNMRRFQARDSETLVIGEMLDRTVTLEDSGELATGSFYAGIPHPPGYPVWTIYTWLWTVLLPIKNIAWRVALAEATGGAIASGLLALLVSRGSSLLIEGIEDLKAMFEECGQHQIDFIRRDSDRLLQAWPTID